MSGHDTEKLHKRAGLIAGLFLLGAGMFFVVSSVHMYRLFDMCTGVACCLCAPGLMVSPYKSSLAAIGRPWVYRASVALACCALPLLLLAGAVPWLGIGSSVAASRMVQYPILYNNRVVHTSGTILVGGGKCTLLAQESASHHSAEKIWLSSKSKLCSAAETTHVHANVTGTFIVLRSKGHVPSNYVLAGATITAQSI